MEVLFTTKQTEKHDVIPGRVVAFIGKNEPFYDIIRYFMSKRHSMIHRAEYDIFSKIDCDTMKEMVEFLILRVLARTMKFEDYHDYESFLGSIDYYLTNHDINDMQFSSYLKKKKEMSHLFERSRIFQN